MGAVQGLDSAAYSFPGICLWLLILPILNRLYTSVITRNPENNTSKVSCATDMSPTTLFTPRDCPVHRCTVPGGTARWGGGVPGVGYPGWVAGVGGWVGYTGVLPGPSQIPIFSHI